MSVTLLSNNAMTFTENQHGNAVLEKLNQQREMVRCCDVILHVGEEKFHAHRCVLSACSPFFDSRLKAGKTVKEQFTISADNPEVFQCLLAYMYTGTVIVDTKNVSELLKLANKLLILKLKDHCAEYLERYLDPSNCLTILDMANKFNLMSLQKTVCKLISSRHTEVLNGSEILSLSPAKLELFIKSPEWTLSDFEVMKLILSWVYHHIEVRECNLRNLLTLVNWIDISMQCILKIIKEHPLFQFEKSSYFFLDVLHDNYRVLPPELFEEYNQLKNRFSQMSDVDFDNTQFLKMAEAAAFDEIQLDSSLIKDKNVFNDVLGGASNLEQLLDEEAYTRKNINLLDTSYSAEGRCDVLFDNKQSQRSYLQEHVNVDGQSFYSKEPEKLRESFSGDKYSAYQREKNKLLGQSESNAGVKVSHKFNDYSNKLVNESDVYERSLVLQESSKNFQFESGTTSQDAYNQTQYYNYGINNEYREPQQPPLCGLEGELLDLNRMNPEEQSERVIQAFHELEACQEGSQTDGKASLGLNNINSVLFPNEYSNFDYSEDPRRSNSPQDMTLPHIKPPQEQIALEKNLDDFGREQYVEDNFIQNDPPRKESELIIQRPDGNIPLTGLDRSSGMYGKLKFFKWALNEEKQGTNVEENTHSHVEEEKSKSLNSFQNENENVTTDSKINTQRECDICKLKCSNSKEYFAHMKEHFPGPPHECDICTVKFNRIYHLLDHRNIHTEDKPFKCTDCNFSTKRLCNLKEHKVIHLGEKNFKCDECGANFSRKKFLKDHMTKHTDERPFKCQTCNWTGKTRSSLITHNRTHSGELYSCQYQNCPYRTPKKSHLTEHMQYHAKCRTFICDVCSLGFITKSHLLRHTKKHSTENLISCPQCHFTCSRKDGMKNHIKNKHTNKKTETHLYRKSQLKKKDAMLSNANTFSTNQENHHNIYPSESGKGLFSVLLEDDHSMNFKVPEND